MWFLSGGAAPAGVYDYNTCCSLWLCGTLSPPLQVTSSVPQVRSLNVLLDAGTRWRSRLLECFGPLSDKRAPKVVAAAPPLPPPVPTPTTIRLPSAAARKSLSASSGAAAGPGVDAASAAGAVLAQLYKSSDALRAAAESETAAALTEAKLFCVCRMPHVDGVLMICCDACSEWCVRRFVGVCGVSVFCVFVCVCVGWGNRRGRALVCTGDRRALAKVDGVVRVVVHCNVWLTVCSTHTHPVLLFVHVVRHRFHPQCIGIFGDDAEGMASFRCPGCQRKKVPKKLKLYCVCRSADEDGDMIACDFCPEWCVQQSAAAARPWHVSARPSSLVAVFHFILTTPTSCTVRWSLVRVQVPRAVRRAGRRRPGPHTRVPVSRVPPAGGC